MQIQILICYTKVNQSLNSNESKTTLSLFRMSVNFVFRFVLFFRLCKGGPLLPACPSLTLLGYLALFFSQNEKRKTNLINISPESLTYSKFMEAPVFLAFGNTQMVHKI